MGANPPPLMEYAVSTGTRILCAPLLCARICMRLSCNPLASLSKASLSPAHNIIHHMAVSDTAVPNLCVPCRRGSPYSCTLQATALCHPWMPPQRRPTLKGMRSPATPLQSLCQVRNTIVGLPHTSSS